MMLRNSQVGRFGFSLKLVLVVFVFGVTGWGCRSRSRTQHTSGMEQRMVQPVRQPGGIDSRPVSKPGNLVRKPTTTRPVMIPHRLQTQYRYIPVGAVWKPDPRMQAWLAPYRKELHAKMSQVLVHLNQSFTRQKPESSLGNLIADICLEKLRQMGLGVEVFVTNHGGIRRDLPAGAITLSVVYQILPFENELVVVRVSGQELQQIFAKIAQLGGEPIAGAKIRYDAQKRALLSATVGDEPLDLNRNYWLGTSDYLVATGFLQTYLRGKSFYVTGITLRDTFRWGLETKAVSLQPQIDQRMGVVGSSQGSKQK